MILVICCIRDWASMRCSSVKYVYLYQQSNGLVKRILVLGEYILDLCNVQRHEHDANITINL